jgi:hypothetical protein
METIEVLKTIETILELCIMVCGALFALWIFLRDKRRDTIKQLANQVIAYNCLEQEYLEVLLQNKDAPKKEVKVEMRRRAEKHDKNVNKVYPDMKPSDAKRHLNLI